MNARKFSVLRSAVVSLETVRRPLLSLPISHAVAEAQWKNHGRQFKTGRDG
jgi:hypothetical protein